MRQDLIVVTPGRGYGQNGGYSQDSGYAQDAGYGQQSGPGPDRAASDWGASLDQASGGWGVPDDYQQGATVRIMFIHVPAALTGMLAYACLAGSAFFGLVFRHALADAAARAAAPLGAAVTFLGLVTGPRMSR